jgi:hypothetical protein
MLLSFAFVWASVKIWYHRGLLKSFVLINVSNKDCAASVIHEGLDPIPDMSRSIDSSIFVMRHAPLYTTDFLKHIGPTLHRRDVACERNSM